MPDNKNIKKEEIFYFDCRKSGEIYLSSGAKIYITHSWATDVYIILATDIEEKMGLVYSFKGNHIYKLDLMLPWLVPIC